MELKSNNGNSSDSEIAAAEMRRMELLAEKERVCRNVESNHQIKAQLQKQLQSILMTQAQEKGIELKTTQLNSQAHSLSIGYLDCISMGTSQGALSSSVP